MYGVRGVLWLDACGGRCVVCEELKGIALMVIFFFLVVRRPPKSTQSRSSATSDVYKRQSLFGEYIYMYILLIAHRLFEYFIVCPLYTSPSPRDRPKYRMPSPA